ncbi:hypothetical protein [Nocardiopsis coralliicola]
METIEVPAGDSRWRCAQCGNLTRFDVVRTVRTRDYLHFDLSGESRVEEREVLEESVEQVRCRWCDATGSVEAVDRPDAPEA